MDCKSFFTDAEGINYHPSSLEFHRQLSACLQDLMRLSETHQQIIVEALYLRTSFGRDKEASLQRLKDENERMARRFGL